jgi:hypothetical protein
MKGEKELGMATSVAPKAFRCTVYDEPATLGKVDEVLYVFYDDGRIVTFEVPMATFTCVLGEIGLQEAARLADRRHGGSAAIACSRAQEVA